ncbi:hypothetical protein [Flavobacterium celericrescens]|uniref:Outer membrane protein beta-barrel domain-containing protein n=1 Tax=Flavobacterium celericrescens TaxID=2709780 RepID=A0ABX0ID29_9FLAO|nr:hypothetical protein [Flavobacterium celericrescens]NHM05115.1 hypothetical protein [Flavobacterium celericrescens]
MKKKSLFFAITLVAIFFTNTSQAQFSIEANYGLNGSFEPSYNGFTHFGGGVSYDFDETFGAKIDFASDTFSIENEDTGIESGSKNTRISLQGVMNVSNLIDSRASYGNFRVLAHAGGGLSILKSDIPTLDKTDHIANVIMGISPQYKVAENLYLGLDASMIFNISQHYYFDGTLTYVGQANSITGIMYNVTAGLTYKFGSY